MSRAGRPALQSGLNEGCHFAGRIDGLSSTPRSDLPQTLNSFLQEAPAPKSYRLEVDLEHVGNGLVLMPGRRFQHDAAALGHLLRGSMGTDPTLEFEAVIGIQLNSPSNAGHDPTLAQKHITPVIYETLH